MLLCLPDRWPDRGTGTSGNLLPSVLDDSLANAWRMIDFNKRGIRCHAELTSAEDGRYTLHCEMTERKKPLFSVDLTVDSEERARRMKETFGSRPECLSGHTGLDDRRSQVFVRLKKLGQIQQSFTCFLGKMTDDSRLSSKYC